MSNLEQLTIAGLLQVQRDLDWLLTQKPKTADEWRRWREGMATALSEARTGRRYLAQVRASSGRQAGAAERLAG